MSWIGKLTKERQGEAIIFSESILWSLFPIITILSFKNVATIVVLFWSLLFATVFFGAIFLYKKAWRDLKKGSVMKDIFAASFFINILFYLLLFNGLRYTTAGNASLIGLTEIFFTFLFFNVWRKEYISSANIIGALLMIAGAVIVLLPNVQTLRIGDFLIMASYCATPFGNFFQRRAREKVGSEAILFIRNMIGLPVIFLLVFFSGVGFYGIDLKKDLFFLLVNGFIMLGFSKILWIEGIHRISVTKATTINSITPLMTLLFAWLILKEMPTEFQLLAFIPMFFGVILIEHNGKPTLAAIRKTAL